MASESKKNVLAVVPSSDGKSSYDIRLSADGSHVYCSCPAWRFQKLTPRARTCKHLKAFANEIARVNTAA